MVGPGHRAEILISSSHGWKINTCFWIRKECQAWQSAFGFVSTPSHSSTASKPKNERRFPCSLQAKVLPYLAGNSSRLFLLATTSFHLSLSECIFLPAPSKLSSRHLSMILPHVRRCILLHRPRGVWICSGIEKNCSKKYTLGRRWINLQLLLIHL